MNDTDEGIRLAKRVAALAGCSRREAELLIENGAVRVDGEPALLPQSRVQPHQQVEIEAGARPAPVVPVTLLLHKPAGTAMEQAHRLLVPANHHAPERAGLRFLPRHVAAQRGMTPLETGASGLVVFTQEWRIERKLHEDAGLLEHEVIADVAGPVGPEQLARLNQAPARVSVSQQAEGHTGLRFAVKGLQPGQIAHQCQAVGLQLLGMRRLRIGRVALAGLLPGQWRYLLPNERF
ncbi:MULTISPECIES: RNA pseudouridine synthase [unclassified Variovorax]|uniref:RNA pseudouridine synthase n=1 Tax=unclassified Variovorax TaxID=663243 RepID=UPI00076D398C|nr:MULTISPECIES: RNA pseudouridine synthase [unclassified Variovorax]KWT83516.1 tRNA pseudouridine synthase A [Variovorax sp. WDL1]PNG59631.1 23S rRNA pseudouridine(2604) synthase [Variovorax sp. B4]PNG60578.1 23S rRNA pseudouridine(2604) synthase [Variovorax sp. B2]VTV13532.1 Ribosomal large subunit pseudouridine synthase F [Variovorax sp. WDL1]